MRETFSKRDYFVNPNNYSISFDVESKINTLLTKDLAI